MSDFGAKAKGDLHACVLQVGKQRKRKPYAPKVSPVTDPNRTPAAERHAATLITRSRTPGCARPHHPSR
jgi:hypothetical protein